MAETRRKFSREFKLEAVRLVPSGGRGMAAAARDLNAPAESFFSSHKTELFAGEPVPPTRDAARQALFEYIEVFYNRKRRHSALLPEGRRCVARSRRRSTRR